MMFLVQMFLRPFFLLLCFSPQGGYFLISSPRNMRLLGLRCLSSRNPLSSFPRSTLWTSVTALKWHTPVSTSVHRALPYFGCFIPDLGLFPVWNMGLLAPNVQLIFRVQARKPQTCRQRVSESFCFVLRSRGEVVLQLSSMSCVFPSIAPQGV